MAKRSLEVTCSVPPAPENVRLGDVVLYVDPNMGDIYPGIVARVLSQGRVLLTAVQPGVTPYAVRSFVEYNAGKGKGTWHWRE